jgi:NAD(P)H-hydrate epimerase
MDILTVAQMREVERTADERGLSYAQMMHNAGNAAAEIILQRLDRLGLRDNARVLVLVGPGNNGGDGLVCATALGKAGVLTQAYLLKPRGDDDPVFVAARDQGIFMADAANDMRLRVLHQMATHANVIVDALLGTGTSRPIDGALRDVLHEVRQVREEAGERTPAPFGFAQGRPPHTRSPAPLLIALDGPTGMNYDTGALDPATVPADLTITFHAPKRGHYCYPAAGACGELVVAPIGIERLEIRDWRLAASLQSPTLRQAQGKFSNLQLADDELICALLPSRKLNANKGTFGRAVIVGGCSDYVGAPALAASAAYRIGAGLVVLAVPQSAKLAAALTAREAIFVSTPDSTDALSTGSLESIHAWIKGSGECAVLIGPGMGQAETTAQFLRQFVSLLASSSDRLKGLVFDADALNLLSKLDEWHKLLPPNAVLTPHPGEVSRLARSTVAEIQADRIGNGLKYATAWGHVVVLKGAHTVVAAPDEHAIVLPFANPALAVAGTGDVLAGCIVGLLAQGLSPFDAAVCGAYLHAAAGERWRTQHGDAGLLASDLLTLLPDVIARLQSPSRNQSTNYQQPITNSR